MSCRYGHFTNRNGHIRSFPTSPWPTKVPNRQSRLSHKVDIIEICFQNHSRKSSSLLWTTNHMHVQLLRVIISDNGMRFSNLVMINFCQDLGIQTKFISVLHPQANMKTELTSKVILDWINKKLDD